LRRQESPAGGSVSARPEVLPFPYLVQLGVLVEEGKIREARNLLEIAGRLIPQDSKLREVLAPPRIRKSEEKGVDRRAEFQWLRVNADAYQGKWVALVGDELVASAGSLKELLPQIKELPAGHLPLIHRLG